MIKEHNSYLILTDLEPDDTQALRQLFLHIQQIDASSNSDVSTRAVGIVVGEGVSSTLKVERTKILLEQLQSEGLLSSKLKIEILEGYSNTRGPQKGFEAEGSESLHPYLTEQAKKQTPLDKEAVKAQIANFLDKNPQTLIVSLKPMVELFDLYNLRNDIFKKHTFSGTGSFNIRSIFPRTEDVSVLKNFQQQIIDMLKSFAQSYLYETFTSTRANSLNEINGAEYFNYLSEAPENSFGYSQKKLIKNWGDHLLHEDKVKFPELINALLKENFSINEYVKILQDNVCVHLYKDLDNEVRAKLTDAVSNVTKFFPNEPQKKDSEKLVRISKKWKNITESGLQFVMADPGLIAAITGKIDNALTAKPVALQFNGSYTKLVEPQESESAGQLFAFIPCALTLEQAQKDEKECSVEEKQFIQEAFKKAFDAVAQEVCSSVNKLESKNSNDCAKLAL